MSSKTVPSGGSKEQRNWVAQIFLKSKEDFAHFIFNLFKLASGVKMKKKKQQHIVAKPNTASI